jgi:penicillin-binding protein 2
MRKRLARAIPSMYQRRLLLVSAGMLFALALPIVQLARLTVVRGDELREQAERRLVSETWLPTVRGQIVDRKGRVLATDRPTYDIAVDYPVITGRWADAQAARKARRENRARWGELSPEQRRELINAARPEFDLQLEDTWERFSRISGIPRAEIEERKREIVAEVQELAVTITERERLERADQLGRGEETADVRTADVRRPIREERTAHVVLRAVSEPVGIEFLRIERITRAGDEDADFGPEAMPGLRVLDSARRVYPMDTVQVDVPRESLPPPIRGAGVVPVRVEGVATHVIGWTGGKVFREDIEARPSRRPDGTVDPGHYRAGDTVGRGGMERAAEFALRGLRGVRVEHLDTGVVQTIAPERGADVPLTIDAALQARIHALFSPELGLASVQPWNRPAHQEPMPDREDAPRDLPMGTPLNGAAVVIDVATGDILALVSAPSFSHAALDDPRSASAVFADRFRMPYLNRCLDKPYPPGSIVKPILLTAATTTGRYSTGETVDCTGHFFPDKPLLYRCWIYKQNSITHNDQFGHGLNGSEALQCSCNIFFFEMGRRLGPEGVVDWYRRFGVGPAATPWDLFRSSPDERRTTRPTSQEFPGVLPKAARMDAAETILLGIGQGPIAWTPLHAADVYATLARGGVRLLPRIRTDAPVRREDLRLDAEGVRASLEGLRWSAERERGTTHSVTYTMPDGEQVREPIFNAPGVTVWAKSGTADTGPFRADLSGIGEQSLYDGDHAWCVLLAGVGEEPRYAIAVVVDYGGSGGRMAGPVANQVVHALALEGYLPRPVPDDAPSTQPEADTPPTPEPTPEPAPETPTGEVPG